MRFSRSLVLAVALTALLAAPVRASAQEAALASPVLAQPAPPPAVRGESLLIAAITLAGVSLVSTAAWIGIQTRIDDMGNDSTWLSYRRQSTGTNVCTEARAGREVMGVDLGYVQSICNEADALEPLGWTMFALAAATFTVSITLFVLDGIERGAARTSVAIGPGGVSLRGVF
jgi:hypothetical protein